MPLLENITRRPQIYIKVVDLARGEQLFRLEALPVTPSDNPLYQNLCISVRTNIDKFPSKICVRAISGSKQMHNNWTGNFNVLRQGRSRVYQNIAALFCGSLVIRAYPRRVHRNVSTQRGDRSRGVVGEMILGFLSRRRRVQNPISQQGFGLPTAVQVVACVLSSLERPFALIPPIVRTHYINRNRRLTLKTIVQTFQPGVKPSESPIVAVWSSLIGEGKLTLLCFE